MIFHEIRRRAPRRLAKDLGNPHNKVQGCYNQIFTQQMVSRGIQLLLSIPEWRGSSEDNEGEM